MKKAKAKSSFRRTMLIVAALIVVVLAVPAIYVYATFDAAAARAQLSSLLSEKLGRKVSLDGPIGLGLSLQDGFTLKAQNITIAAKDSAPTTIQRLNVGVALPPLLKKQIDVRSFHMTADKAKVDLRTTTPDHFVAKASYGPINLDTRGAVKLKAGEVELTDYTLKAGSSTITGQATINFAGARPVIRGTMKSDKLDPSDFTAAMEEKPAGKVGQASAKAEQSEERIFSSTPLAFDGLKKVDAHIEATVGEVPAGPSKLKDLRAKIDLTNGRLLLSPVSMMFGGSRVEGQMRVDASAPTAQVSALLKAHQIDLMEVMRLSGISAVINGKGDMDLDVMAYGQSMRELASRANGRINVVTAGGSVSKQELGKLAGSFLDLFAPGTGNLAKPEVNCFVARFKIIDGVMHSDGLLMDTSQATIAGTGGVSLKEETVDMAFRARGKGAVGVGSFSLNAGDLTLPLRVKGMLKKPEVKADVDLSAQKVVGFLQGGELMSDSGVPTIVTQQGQNACQYTLDHPQAQPKATTTTPNVVTKARDKVKDVGGKMLEGLRGKLFGK